MSGHSGRGVRLQRTEPPPVGLAQERCYCWSLGLPYVHTLADHGIGVKAMRRG